MCSTSLKYSHSAQRIISSSNSHQPLIQSEVCRSSLMRLEPSSRVLLALVGKLALDGSIVRNSSCECVSRSHCCRIWEHNSQSAAASTSFCFLRPFFFATGVASSSSSSSAEDALRFMPPPFLGVAEVEVEAPVLPPAFSIFFRAALVQTLMLSMDLAPNSVVALL